MSERKIRNASTRWLWAALATAAPVFAQDDASKIDRRNPPPIPTPPASNEPVNTPVHPAPRREPKQTVPAKQAQIQPPNAQPPVGPGPTDPTTRDHDAKVRSIIDSNASNPVQKAADQREALLLYQQALAAQQANRTADALRLGRRAKQLFPANQDIANFVAQVQRESTANKVASPSSTRAKAYLAAGYARGSELMRAGRTAQGEDLLLGVMEASRLFPDQTQVDFYRRLAEHELEQFKMTQPNGTQAPAPGNADPNVVPPPEPARPAVATPPDNTRRLISMPDARVPVWYVQQKNRLTKSMTVDYRGVPVSTVLDDIARKTGVEFVIDRPVALARSHVNTIVDFRAGDLSAEFILDLVCQKAGFEYVLMEKSVVITTRSKAIVYFIMVSDSFR
jgi:hypothetical protein